MIAPRFGGPDNDFRDRISLGLTLPPRQRLGFSSTTAAVHESADVWYSGPHLLTGAPTGTGKGRSCLIPTLLTNPSLTVTVDIKGELYCTTARRRREMGQRVIKLDPFRVVDDATDSFNPLDCMTLPNSDIGTDCQTMASLLSYGMEFSKDKFWDHSACGLISGLLAYLAVCETPEKRTIPRLRDLLHQDDVIYNIAVLLDTKGKAMPRQAYQELAAFLQHPERDTRPSVQSTAVAYLKAFMSDRVADAFGPSSFSLADFVSGEPMTIYIILPADRLESHRAILRLWFGSLMRAIFSRTRAPDRPTLLLVDEAAQLGHFPMLQTAVTLTRSYGVRCWMLFQDLQQIMECYPNGWQTLINNCGAINVFGVASKLMADAWTKVLDCSSQDLLQLGPDEQIVQLHGRSPVRTRKHDYLLDRRFASLFDENRFYTR
jgi:type IV secretion system protein VirD4